jgi:hypothetical protein
MKCQLCHESGWVCESHPDEPWDGPMPAAAGLPAHHARFCEHDRDSPRLPSGFTFDRDGWRHLKLTGATVSIKYHLLLEQHGGAG